MTSSLCSRFVWVFAGHIRPGYSFGVSPVLHVSAIILDFVAIDQVMILALEAIIRLVRSWPLAMQQLVKMLL
jgi:hypothetical protein